jgi:xylan 1,4-beta-xylosidase
LWGLALLLWPLAAPAQIYTNPVLPGFFPDPSIVRVGDDYYVINSTFQYFPAIVISHSKDLVHWRQIGHVFTNRADLDLSEFYDGCGIWAPDLSYHDGEFYVFYCLVQLKKDRSVNVRGNYMVRSRGIHGPWSKPVQLTEEGNDPSHFVDEDGTHWMCYAGGIPKGSATKIVKLNADCTRVVEGPFWIDYGGEKRAPEGPHLFKRGGYYYHTMAASGGIYNGHHQLIARSTNVLGPYEFSPHNPFIAQLDRTSPLQHQGHAKLVETQRGEWWAVYLLQRRINGFSPLGRETGLDRVDWQADGWPVLNGGHGPSLTNDLPQLPVTPQPVERRDDFRAPQLGVQWQFIRAFDPARIRLSDRSGWLRLLGGEFDVDSPRARSLVLRRETCLHYQATTKLEFDPRPGAQAGLVCYYDTMSYLKLALTDRGSRKLVIEECRKRVKTTLAETPVRKSKTLYLRVRVQGLSRWFDYSYDNRRWQEAGAVPDASFLSDQGTPQWGFMGTLVGVFAVNTDASRTVPADFDWFHLDEPEGARH